MRAVSEWFGKTDDTAIPARVRLRVFEQCRGLCSSCQRKLYPGDKWDCDHRIALINGGENREGNLRLLCAWCHKAKTRQDVAIKSKTYRVRSRHLGIRPQRPSFQTNRNGPFRKKMTGEVVRR